MITKILIFLVAVVVLIMIIAFLALRYLRAEDSDPFEDMPDEPRRPARPSFDGPLLDEAPTMVARNRPPRPVMGDGFPRPAGGPARPASSGLALADGPGGPGPQRPPAGYRDRGSEPRPVAPDRRNGGQRPLAASARSRAGMDNSEPSWDALSDVDYWAELGAAERAAKSAASPSPSARRPAGLNADAPPRLRPADGRSITRGEPATGPQAPMPMRQPSLQQAAASRAGQPPAALPPNAQPRASGPRPTPAPPRSRSGEYDQPRQPAPRSQHAPGRYRGIADGVASGVANGTAPPSGPPSGPIGSGLPPSGPPSGPIRSGLPPSGPPSGPIRSGLPPSGLPPSGLPPSGLPPSGLPPSRPSSSRPTSGPLPVPSRRGNRGRQHEPADDPLTSPSFPAINTTDSRSYRARRSDSQPAPARPAAARAEPAQQPSNYPERPARTPDAHRSQSVTSAPVAAIGNPYGSYVSQPPTDQQPPATSSDLSFSGSRGGSHRAPEPVPSPWPGQAGQSGEPNGNGAGGYQSGDGIAQSAGGTAPYADPARYPRPAPGADQYDQRSYQPSESSYGLDPYQGYPGNGSGAR